jgi:glycosyltransferase involved in cell wall biosynthesis
MKIIIIGPIPPPTHGMAVINKQVSLHFEKRGYDVILAEKKFYYDLLSRLGRLSRIFSSVSAAFHIIVERLRFNKFACYFGLSGGYGLLAEIPLVLLARLVSDRIIFHHHSYNYINQDFWPFRILSRISGDRTLHICLSEGMAQKLSARYISVKNSIVVSNSSIISSNVNCTEDEVLQRDSSQVIVGMLANLSVEKGVDEFIEIAKRCNLMNKKVRFILAGPFQDAGLRKTVLMSLANVGNVEYWGPLYKEDKKRFYRTINVFLFPTKYRNEAEPLVVLDAMSLGIPVLSYSRGCIDEILDNSGGKAFSPEIAMIDEVIVELDIISANQIEFKKRMLQTFMKYHDLRSKSCEALNQLEKLIFKPN